MQREIYTHETLAALHSKQREQQMRQLAYRAMDSRGGFTRRTAHRIGSLFFQLGTRLMAYGANPADARTGVDLRYS